MGLLILTIVLLGCLAWARKSRPASDKQGVGFVDSANICVDHSGDEEGKIKVACFNIQTGKNLQGHRNINASAALLSQADVVGVQEVYGPTFLNLLGLGADQTSVLARTGRFGSLFAATRRRWLKEHRGNAVLSKLAMGDWSITMLPDQSNKSYRNFTSATLTWQGRSFQFINTHLHTKSGRDEQLRLVLNEFARHDVAILVGDLNTRADSATLQNALRDVQITDAIGQLRLDPCESKRIDWILTKGFEILEGKFVEKGISDHPYYEVHLRYYDHVV